MTVHRYRVREIAEQAGLSPATVDRVLHGRAGVRPDTAATVHQAVKDLDGQRTRARLRERPALFDLVMLAPDRFTSAVQRAVQLELPTLRPAVVRFRFHLRSEGTVRDLVRTLDRLGRRGTHGIVLKAPDDPDVTAAVARLAERGIGVVTLVTDLPASARAAYVGIDNRAAGATAAYLLEQVAGHRPGDALLTLTRSTFRGEEEREMGFRVTLRELASGRAVHVVSGTDGLDASMLPAVSAALAEHEAIDRVYSIGGGNRAMLDAFDRAGRAVHGFVAHDLDRDNVELLRAGRLTAVLHHDLRADVRQACRLLLQHRGALPGTPRSTPSQIQVITPYNTPPG